MTFFYDLNKKLDSIREKPETTHKQLNERAMMEKISPPIKTDPSERGKYQGKSVEELKAMKAKHLKHTEAQREAGKPVAQADKEKTAELNFAIRAKQAHGGKWGKIKEEGLEEGMMDTVKSAAQKTLDVLGHGSDEDMIRDLQRKAGVPATGKVPTATPGSTAKPATTNPTMAEADMEEGNRFVYNLKKAREAGKKEADLDGDGDMEPVREGAKPDYIDLDKDRNRRESMKKAAADAAAMKEASEDNAFTAHKRPKVEKPAVGTVTHGRKHDVEEIPGGRRVTRRVDPSGISVGADDEAAQSGEKRGRGRPKGPAKAPERVTGGATKHKGGRKMSKEEIEEAISALEGHGYSISKLDEKAVSVAQRRAAGIAHAAQKGEIPKSELRGASKEMAKMPKGELTKFAKTKEKGLPNKKTEEVEETTVAGSVAPSTAAPKSKGKGGMTFGKGIYDSLNRDLEAMIAESMQDLRESMSVNMSMNNDDMHGGPTKSLTVTATDEDAVTLSQLLKSAGLGGGEQGGCGCGSSPCSCGSNAEVVDENQPDWPTDTEQAQDNFGYAGGLNKPKSTGQTTVPVIASQSERQSMTEDMQADDGVPYQSSDDFFSQFEAGHFDDEQVSPDGMEVRGYIDGKNVMVWRFDDESKTSGYGKYDDSALGEQQSYAEAEQDALHRMMEMAGIEFTEEMLEEGWREKLGAAGMAGAMALGSLGAGAAQAAPQQGLGAPTAATQQQTQDIWMPAYQRALSLSSAVKDPVFKQELDKLSQFYQEQSNRIGLSGKLSKNMDPKASQDQKQLDLKYKDRLEQLIQRYGANESVQEEDAIKRMMEMAGVKKKEVDEEKTEEGNLFTGNLAKARAAGKKEADIGMKLYAELKSFKG